MVGRTRGDSWRLERGAERIAQWRRTRTAGDRIPEKLWVMATGLAGEYGVSRTASALMLDYYALKRRVEEAASESSGRVGRPGFIELPATTLAVPGDCVIELENRAGSKMRIHWKGNELPDLTAICRGFWSAE